MRSRGAMTAVTAVFTLILTVIGGIGLATSAGASDPSAQVAAAAGDCADKLAKAETVVAEATKLLETRTDAAAADQQKFVKAKKQVKKAKKRQNTLQACANQFGCPDERFSDNDRGRCTTCANYLRKHARDRTGRYEREAS